MDEVDNIPKHWKLIKLNAAAKFIDYRGKTPQKTSSGIPLITAKNVKMGFINEEPREFIAEKDYKSWMTRGIPNNGDVLFTTEAPLGNVAQLKTNSRIALAQRLITFQTYDSVNNSFLKFSLMSPQFQDMLNSKGTGTTVKGIKAAILKQLEIPLPPLSEQTAIVSKIEELFSDLENGRQQLLLAQKQLKTYRQSLLKWAFEGRMSNKSIIKKTFLAEVIEQPRYGTSKKCSYEIKGKGVLRIPNIGNGVVDAADLKFAKFEYEEIETYSLKKGDILTIRSNGSVDLVGKCALITKKETDFLFAGYLIRLRPLRDKINPNFLLLVLSSHDLRIQIESKAKSTSGVNNINSEELKSLQIPLPPLKEQEQIVSELERKLTVCDKIEETITNSLLQAEIMKQSILKRAFEGKLLN